MCQVTVEKVESGKVGEKSENVRHFAKAVPFILGHVFFERFCSGGVLGKFYFF